MTINDRIVESVVYRRIAPVLLVLAFTIAIGAAVGTYVNTRAVNTANTARLEDQARLLGCFDRFATALAGGLPPVRVASAARDDALAAAAAALESTLVKVAVGKVEPGDVRGVIDALDTYQRANDHLTDVRRSNPYPDAPSKFCEPLAVPPV